MEQISIRWYLKIPRFAAKQGLVTDVLTYELGFVQNF